MKGSQPVEGQFANMHRQFQTVQRRLDNLPRKQNHGEFTINPNLGQARS